MASSNSTELQSTVPVPLTGPGIPEFIEQYSEEGRGMSSTSNAALTFDTPGPISSLFAVLIADVSIESLQLGINDVDAHGSELKSCLVPLPIETSSVAVLSWRWDGDHKGRGSRNILRAVIYAKQVGIRYLFIDVVSIDQSLEGDELIKQVMLFSTLYTTVPVLVAYQKEGTIFWETVRRPWILSEIFLIRSSPSMVTFVDHSTDYKDGWLAHIDIPLVFHTRHATAYFQFLMELLCRQCDMTAISDLKFLMPDYAKILAISFQKMSRDDYLLTAITLHQLFHKTRSRTVFHRRESRFPRFFHQYELDYDKETLFQLDDTEGYSRQIKLPLVLSLRGRKVIHVLVTNGFRDMDINTVEVYAHPDADLAILDALDIGAEGIAEYLAKEDTRVLARERVNTRHPTPSSKFVILRSSS
ncbi:hypothetical protein GLAREA_08889 [Glarea lozoyensis ATCC 20868]|uniref:Heterokaryon incompatibility domain-containing protein n=1 Tax=Glarea lozoyensis (strain ATCC 20868 / MF5171) TaxID=1116229 RepID=S3DXT3_GLAL2|nr:uncharacterized protein GLAREA_08889 [Glarea lozoyensis ATCC 20868]EPE36726.1 hypothetical protein GLAREA_08889 [Glarea lozoyensis ATCC 20868]